MRLVKAFGEVQIRPETPAGQLLTGEDGRRRTGTFSM
jgi:hypothetical protein